MRQAGVHSQHAVGLEFFSTVLQGQSSFPPCGGARVHSLHAAGLGFVHIVCFMQVSFPSPCGSAELQIQATISGLKKKVCVPRVKLKSSGLQGEFVLSSEPSHWLFIFFQDMGLLIAQASLEQNMPVSAS